MNESLGGAWITYSWSDGISVDSVFADELEALRSAVESGYLHVAFVPFGTEIRQAVK